MFLKTFFHTFIHYIAEKMNKIKLFVKKHFLNLLLLGLFLLLSVISKVQISQIYKLVAWKTIFFLFALMIFTFSIKETNFFNVLALKIIQKFNTKQKLALFLIVFSAFLASFLTNDIALFIVIPITLEIRKFSDINLTKFFVIETISVNVGSALTPFGNPQNIFIWRHWDIPFFKFIAVMLPVFLLQITILIAFGILIFKKQNIHLNFFQQNKLQIKNFIIALIFMFGFLTLYELDKFWISFAVVIIFILLNFKILSKIDYELLILFILIFINFNLLASLDFVKINFLKLIDNKSFTNIFLNSTLLSQVISNVPASVFMSNFTNNWKPIAYGVNIGANGFIISSLANLIGLKLSKNKKFLKTYHAIAIPFLIITLGIIFLVGNTLVLHYIS